MLRHLTRLPLRTQPLYTSAIVRRPYSASKQPEPEKPTNKTSPNETDKSTSTTSPSDVKAADPKDDLVNAVIEEEKPKETYEEREKRMKRNEIGYAFGANHWNLERFSSILLVPLVSTQLVYGAHPVVDGLVSVVLPYHIYMGFDSCVTDYIPKRVYPRGYKAAMWSLKASMALTMWGCYEFNTNDIGITEAIQRLWTA